MARGAQLFGALLVVVALAAGAHAQRIGPRRADVASAACANEWQVVFCGDIPLTEPARREACCDQHAAKALPPTAAAAVAGAKAQQAALMGSVERSDLGDGDSPMSILAKSPRYYYGQCTESLTAKIPVFSRDENGTTTVTIDEQVVPALTRGVIAAVKRRAMAAAPRKQRKVFNSLIRAAQRGRIKSKPGALRFVHPGGYAGPWELALMETRLERGVQPQRAANDSLITGRGVPPKVYGSDWVPPVDTPAEGYQGPYAMERLECDYGGWIMDNKTCPANYPAGAPLHLCGHLALVELDSRMAYKQAMAYATNRDERHARQAIGILMAWADTNKVFGLKGKNGPLEAGWAIAAMARALEVLRATWPGFERGHLRRFMGWVDEVMMPQMDFYTDIVTPNSLAAGRRALYGNWHATIADAMMAVGVLADDRPRYEKGLALYRTTVREYFKWGRGYAPGRILGEATETLRDIYHTLFGLGSLMQAAETAWGQNDDVYSEAGHVMAAAMELHARIINAKDANSEAALPPGFKFYTSMPPPPANCTWKWEIETQTWSSWNVSEAGQKAKCSDLNDGVKYLLGIKYLPNGFELGYNHYVGRLGMRLPETAALLSANRVDWFEFCWGLATLTHADTAKDLWRVGLKRKTLCRPREQRGAPYLQLSPPGAGPANGSAAARPPGVAYGEKEPDASLGSLVPESERPPRRGANGHGHSHGHRTSHSHGHGRGGDGVLNVESPYFGVNLPAARGFIAEASLPEYDAAGLQPQPQAIAAAAGGTVRVASVDDAQDAKQQQQSEGEEAAEEAEGEDASEAVPEEPEPALLAAAKADAARESEASAREAAQDEARRAAEAAAPQRRAIEVVHQGPSAGVVRAAAMAAGGRLDEAADSNADVALGDFSFHHGFFREEEQ